MAEAIIGGRVWSVSLPNFRKLKAAWRYIEQVQITGDPMAERLGHPRRDRGRLG